MRTSITGVFDYFSPSRVFAHTAAMCGVTHADPRCLASCVLTSGIISAILRGSDISSPQKIESLIEQTVEQTIAAVPLGEHEADFREYTKKNLAQLELDDAHGIGYTLKCMGSGLVGLRSEESFEITLNRLAREAGDADTNGATCGALLGAKLGYARLPAEWIRALPHRKWLGDKLVPFIRLVSERANKLRSEPELIAASAAANASNSKCVVC